jgi:2-dehydropantoate 2-reductase
VSAAGETVAVVGPGAIGLTFAAAAHAAGRPLVVCGRRPLEGPISVGLTGGERIDVDVPVSTDPAAVAAALRHPVDVVLVAVKAHQTAGAAAWLDALTGPDTVVAVLQNGVQQREVVAPFVPRVARAAVLPCVVWTPASIDAPGHVTVRGAARLVTEAGPAGERLAAALTPSFAVVDRTDALDRELWHKLTVNAVAGLMALAAPNASIFARADVRDVALALGRECAAVAAATGVPLPDDLPEQVLRFLAELPAQATTSIAVDRVNGRELEWDARNGVVNRLGARHGVPTPVSDVVTPLLAAVSDAAAATAGA